VRRSSRQPAGIDRGSDYLIPRSAWKDGATWPQQPSVFRMSVLFLEEDQPFATAFKRELSRYAVDVTIAGSLSLGRDLLAKMGASLDAILFDLSWRNGRVEDLLPDIDALPRQSAIVILADPHDPIRPLMVCYRPIFVPKTIAPESLIGILTATVDGYVQYTILRFARRFALSSKQLQILNSLAMGLSPKEVALGSNRSTQAVYAHMGRICAKSGCKNYQEVVALLFRFACHGLGHPTENDKSADAHRMKNNRLQFSTLANETSGCIRSLAQDNSDNLGLPEGPGASET
jgi:DNA-binding NarL/FixJ family response regulator